MVAIRIADHLKTFSSYDDGKKIYELIRPALLSGQDVTLSFDEILAVPSAFVNAALLQLLNDMPFEQIKKRLHIVNISCVFQFGLKCEWAG